MSLRKWIVFLGIGFFFFTQVSFGRNLLSAGLKNLTQTVPPIIKEVLVKSSKLTDSTSSQKSGNGKKSASSKANDATTVPKRVLTLEELEKDFQMVKVADNVWIYWTDKTKEGGMRPVLPTTFVNIPKSLDKKPQQLKVKTWLPVKEFDKPRGLVPKIGGLGEGNVSFYSGYKTPYENILAGNIALGSNALGALDPGNGKFNLGIVSNNNSPETAEARALIKGLNLKEKGDKLKSFELLYPKGWHFSEAVRYTSGMKDLPSFLGEYETPQLIANSPDVWIQFGSESFRVFVQNYRVLQKMPRADILLRIEQEGYKSKIANYLAKNPGVINLDNWDTESLRILRAKLLLCDKNSCGGIINMGRTAWADINPKDSILRDQAQRVLNINVVDALDLIRIRDTKFQYLSP